jgi:hypothetical protein
MNFDHPPGGTVGKREPQINPQRHRGDMLKVRAMAAEGEYRSDTQSPDWIGRAVAEVLNLDAEDDKARIKALGKVWFAVAQAAPPHAARVEQRWRAPWRKNPTVSGRAVTAYRASSAKWARDATRL